MTIYEQNEFRKLIIKLVDECPFNDQALQGVAERLFDDEWIMAVGNGRMKPVASALEHLRRIVVDNRLRSITELIGWYEQKITEGTEEIKKYIQMTPAERATDDHARRQRLNEYRQERLN